MRATAILLVVCQLAFAARIEKDEAAKPLKSESAESLAQTCPAGGCDAAAHDGEMRKWWEETSMDPDVLASMMDLSSKAVEEMSAEELQRESERLTERNAWLEKELDRLDKENAEMEARIAAAEEAKRQEAESAEAERLAKHNAFLEEEIRRVDAENTELERKIAEAEKYASTSKNIEDMTDEEIEAETKRIAEHNSVLEMEVERLDKENAELEAQIAARSRGEVEIERKTA